MLSNEARGTAAAADVDLVIDGYRELARTLAGSRMPELPDSSVTMAQMKVLMLLSSLGELRMSELATDLHISQSTASGLVERLVESGLVMRRGDEHDRRQVIVCLTPAGGQFLDHFQELGISHLRELMALLSPTEVATVRRALEVLIKAAHELPKEDHS
jgi:DNA-binding MarR family transcriptional regulator